MERSTLEFSIIINISHLITRPEESYWLWRVFVCDLETSKEEAKSPLKGCEYKPTMGCDAEREKNN
jgi:hypothetical protein